MSNLEPEVHSLYTQKRAQLDAFLGSDSLVAQEVKGAVEEMMAEYHGYIERLATGATLADTRKPGFREGARDHVDGVERIARFAVWRALVNRENAERRDPILPGSPRFVPKVIDDGEGGFMIVRPDSDGTESLFEQGSVEAEAPPHIQGFVGLEEQVANIPGARIEFHRQLDERHLVGTEGEQ